MVVLVLLVLRSTIERLLVEFIIRVLLQVFHIVILLSVCHSFLWCIFVNQEQPLVLLTVIVSLQSELNKCCQRELFTAERCQLI
jgi:hypothetical protein